MLKFKTLGAFSLAAMCGLLLFMQSSLAEAQNTSMNHKGKIYAVPADYLDPAYPAQAVSANDISSAAYVTYLNVHKFPLPEEGDYERRVEIWVKNNMYFPQFLPSGNSAQDSVRLSMAVEVWKQRHPDAVEYMTRTVNTTGLSDADFELLMNSYPHKLDTGDADLDQRRYDDAVQEWIRIYSYEKYLIIEPIVREAELLNQKAEEGK